MPMRRPLTSVSHTTAASPASALSMVPTTSSAVPSSSRESSLGVWTTPMRISMQPNLVAGHIASVVELRRGARPTAGTAVRESPARLRFAVERGDGGPRGQPRVDQSVLGLVVEGIGERELLRGTDERVLAQPARGAGDGLPRRHEVAVAEIGPHARDV